MFTLKVQNFGVLKDIDIELNKTNLFIGENGSGKSVLAKLITIVTTGIYNEDEILEKFKDFNIDYIKDNTLIEVKINNDKFLIIQGIDINFSELRKEIYKEYKNFIKLSTITENFTNDKLRNEKKEIEKIYYNFTSQDIPAERNLISLLNKSIYSLITSDIPLPKHLLNFASQYEKAKNEIHEISLLKMKYKLQNGQDYIYYNENEFLPLEHSSSGIQSALPMYLVLKYLSSSYSHIIIEEPEQNLYPKAQMDTIKYIIQTTNNNDTHIMTHSPYVLSTLNILLFAYKASNTNSILKDKISKVIPLAQQINPDEFSAYSIKDGKSISIKSQRGLISENSIDDISDILDDKFSKLMDIYSEYKNA